MQLNLNLSELHPNLQILLYKFLNVRIFFKLFYKYESYSKTHDLIDKKEHIYMVLAEMNKYGRSQEPSRKIHMFLKHLYYEQL